MKISYLSVGILSLVAPLTAAWSKEDREIFRIRDEISAHEPNASATFYDILGIAASASQEDINRAYRKKSRSLHPDKVKQHLRNDSAKAGKPAKQPTAAETKAAIKSASERQARLSLIANILRGPSRDRYDHFLTHGFPLWKGTDYYYTRYRPGLGTVMLGVFVVGGGVIHYLILYMNWKRQQEFVGRYVKFAREKAWGGNLGIPTVVEAVPAPAPPSDDDTPPPVPVNRKQRRMQEKGSKREDGGGRPKKKGRKAQAASRETPSGTTAPSGVRKRVVAENGKILVVDSLGDVFLEEEDEEGNVNEYLLDPNELHKPTFKDTAVVRVPMWLFNQGPGRFTSGKATETESDDGADDSDAPQPTPSTDSAGEDFEMLDKSTDSLSKAKATGVQQGAKANKRRGRKR
ncbi:hypothetical protein G6O67_007196 [Ophiocordyceps sinensis]|uniref:J domain-containing protein n=2 Tax=Ophiocordyceps sinensis TaxID=72228 RepID=A0A8H4PLM4_9HYPO|nr:hypothetical protein G6O67_007196 [Ophiocordyceps sinensis]